MIWATASLCLVLTEIHDYEYISLPNSCRMVEAYIYDCVVEAKSTRAIMAYAIDCRSIKFLLADKCMLLYKLRVSYITIWKRQDHSWLHREL